MTKKVLCRRILLMLTIIMAASANARAADDVRYAPKASLRVNSTLISNEGRFKGTKQTIGGLSLSYVHYMSDVWAAGLGYRAEYDYSKGTVPVSGILAFGRWYFSGTGTRIETLGTRSTSTTLDDFGFYVGPQFTYSSYYFGVNPQDKNGTDILEGTVASIDGIIGGDYRLSSSFEVNAEGSLGLLVFSRSDDRYRLRELRLTMGVSYLW